MKLNPALILYNDCSVFFLYIAEALIEDMQDSIVRKKSFTLALAIVHFYKKLTERKEYIIAKQILRSGTSIGANISEAQSAQSKKDFIHKLEIALKEARETEFWLLLLKESKLTVIDINEILQQNLEVIKLLVATIKTLKFKQN